MLARVRDLLPLLIYDYYLLSPRIDIVMIDERRVDGKYVCVCL